MAMICVNRCRECTGCMHCQEPPAPCRVCDACGGWILAGEDYLRIAVPGRPALALCAACVEEAWNREWNQ